MKKMAAIVVCLFLVGSVLGASAVVFAKKPDKPPKPPEDEEKIAEGYEYQITISDKTQFYPAIFGNKIVWTDYRNGNSDIYMYDLGPDGEYDTGDDGGEHQITDEPESQGSPAIYENKIVYTWDNDPGLGSENDIYMYDLSMDSDGDGTPNYLEDPRLSPDPAETQITSGPASDGQPDIYGDKIVFRRMPSGQKDEIFMYDLTTGNEFQLTDEDDPSPNNPRIFGNIVVWDMHFRVPFGKKSARTEWDVVIYHPGSDGVFGTGNDIKYRHQIPDDQRYPAIYDDRIVWEDNRNRKSYMNTNQNWDIYLYYLGGDGIPGTDDDEEYQITQNNNYQRYPDIYDNIIVYMDDRNENWEIYLHNLTDSTEYRVTDNTVDQTSPRIFEYRIVYCDDRNGNSDIYMFTLTQ